MLWAHATVTTYEKFIHSQALWLMALNLALKTGGRRMNSRLQSIEESVPKKEANNVHLCNMTTQQDNVSTQDRRMGRHCQTRGLPSSCGSHFLAALPSSDVPGDLQRSVVPPAGSAWLSQTCHPKGAKWGQSAVLSQWGSFLSSSKLQKETEKHCVSWLRSNEKPAV